MVFRYVDAQGNPTRESNPNGSINNIAGIINKEQNVMAMPHPERACEAMLGSADGLKIFESLRGWFQEKAPKNSTNHKNAVSMRTAVPI